LLDEDTHLFTTVRGPCDLVVYLLRNVPSKSVRPFPDCSGSGPQEPRRPRFSFFHLHNVKELTPRSRVGETSVEAGLPNFGNRVLLPVARQPPCPFREPPTVGARSSRRQRSGVLFETFPSVNTLFSTFGNCRKLKI
jgi:hypothetical protein